MELCPSPSGFSLRMYLTNILEIFEQTFKQDQYPVFETIVFAPTYDFELNNQSFGRKIETPACILDLYELKQAADTATNSGNLYINLCMRALVLLENNKRDPHTFIRQYALDIAGLVTSINLANVNLPQVKGSKEVKEIRESNNFLIGWEVLWEHAVEISPPDYSDIALRNIPEADAIYDVVNNRSRFLQDASDPDNVVDFITEVVNGSN